ncbi:MAG: response regulator transcription factor [Verrucomicrobiota bacterium JB022]|nr:response regulator transcription factor [Verrucomicrobiota bacterium JB022]
MSNTPSDSTPTRAPQIFVIEDHDNLRKLLGVFLDMQDDFEFVGSARSAEDALVLVPEVKPDIIMVDLSLPRMSGVEFVRAIKQELPEVKCIMLSGHNERSHAEQAIAAGAMGYILKGNPLEVGEAIRRCLAGEIIISAELER